MEPSGNRLPFSTGLTKREYFAAMAMQGLTGDPAAGDGFTCAAVLRRLGEPPDAVYKPDEHWPRFIAELAVAQADALIAALSRATGSEQ